MGSNAVCVCHLLLCPRCLVPTVRAALHTLEHAEPALPSVLDVHEPAARLPPRSWFIISACWCIHCMLLPSFSLDVTGARANVTFPGFTQCMECRGQINALKIVAEDPPETQVAVVAHFHDLPCGSISKMVRAASWRACVSACSHARLTASHVTCRALLVSEPGCVAVSAPAAVLRWRLRAAGCSLLSHPLTAPPPNCHALFPVPALVPAIHANWLTDRENSAFPGRCQRRWATPRAPTAWWRCARTRGAARRTSW